MKLKHAADQQAPVADATREDYDEQLVQLNRRLAGTRAEHRRARDALDDSNAEYVGTRERRELVLGENGRLISVRQQSTDRLMAEKQRLVAEVKSHWAVVDDLYERRQVQYEGMLARLKEDMDFVRTRFDTATQRIEHRAAVIDKITRVLENASNLKKLQLEGMYANKQILACSMYNYTEELERCVGSYFEKVLLERSDKRNQKLMQNIKEYYSIVKQFYEYKRKHASAKKDQLWSKLYEKQIKIIVKLKLEWMTAKWLRKKNIVAEKSADFYQEQHNNKIVPQRENTKREPPVEVQDERTSVIEEKRKLIEEVTQEAVTVSQEWKCSYLKELIDEIRTVVDKANQYVTGEGRSSSYDPTDFEWLLNKGAVRHFSTCNTASIQPYDYDVELNINRSYTECNRMQQKQLTKHVTK